MGWVGNVFIVIGIWLVGNRDRRAFLFTIVGEVFWIIAAVGRGQYDLAVICVVFAVLAGRNYVQWGKIPETRR